jgi:hypothetical protein
MRAGAEVDGISVEADQLVHISLIVSGDFARW